MTQEQLAAFMEKVKNNPSLAQQLNDAQGVEAVVKLAKDSGFDVSTESVQKIFDLSEDELEATAGGMHSVAFTGCSACCTN